MIDLHSHLLPGVDDGSKSVDQSVAVLQAMIQQGVTDVCLTPHLPASRAASGPPALQDQAYQALIGAAPPGIRLHRGNEVMLDRPLASSVAADRRVTINGTRYILVEFPRLVTAITAQHALMLIASSGLIPLLAHPERYAACSPESVRRWKETGAVMQVDATTLLASRTRGERARQLVAQGLADIAAADNHGDERTLLAGYQALVAHGGAMQADLLMIQNPGAILEDRALMPVPPLEFRTSIVQRIRKLFEREDA
ncbi:MAG: CpsB/CapC family capsule biosynthesis tyrosine phosphatase [Gemmatimonadota bacterium]